MQPECPFLPTLRHILAFVAKATRLPAGRQANVVKLGLFLYITN